MLNCKLDEITLISKTFFCRKIPVIFFSIILTVCFIRVGYESSLNHNVSRDFLFSFFFLSILYCLIFSINQTGFKYARAFSLIVLVFSFIFIANYFWLQPNQPFTSVISHGERVGFEKKFDSSVVNSFKNIKVAQKTFLKNNEVYDYVPIEFQHNSGTLNTEYYLNREFKKSKKISNSILGGALIKIQSIKINFFIFIFSCLILIFLITVYAYWRAKATFLIVSSLSFITIISLILSLRLSAGWDEFFINLRHSYMLLNHGVYSINSISMIEGTVDLLPMIFTSALGFLGIHLIDASIIVSMLGNVVLIIFSFLLLNKITSSPTYALFGALFIGVYPNVIHVGASGFYAVLFSGIILAAIYYYVFSQRQFLGLFLLSCLTLFRTEGYLIALLMVISFELINYKKSLELLTIFKSLVARIVFVSVPFGLSIVIRNLVYGFPIPIPILFKNTDFDSGYVSSGIDRLYTMISIHDLHISILMIVALYFANYFITRNKEKVQIEMRNINKMIVVDILLLLFITPYYLGGGDWFSPEWNRYGMPLNIFLSLTFLTLIFGAFRYPFSKSQNNLFLVLFSLLIVLTYSKSAYYRPNNIVVTTMKNLLSKNAMKWSRIDNLASLGDFLNKSLPGNAVVASPEEATIMYFSQRNMLGMLGVSNPSIAGMPLQPFESGDILHRRRAYKSIYEDRPDIIALYEPVVLHDFSNQLKFNSDIHAVLQEKVFNKTMTDISYYRVGSYKALNAMGYSHITICLEDRLFSIFVGERIRLKFFKKIESFGFIKAGNDKIEYSVDNKLTKKYMPSVLEISGQL